MQSLSSTGGGVYYRTKLLPLETAASFARCLGNNPAFTAIAIEESQKAKTEKKYFVTFLPANTRRQEEMLDREQSAREARAAEEGAAYVFLLDKDGGRPFFWCFNPKSQETYEVTEHSCTCPDFHFRLRETGLRCKHQLALAQQSREVRTW